MRQLLTHTQFLGLKLKHPNPNGLEAPLPLSLRLVSYTCGFRLKNQPNQEPENKHAGNSKNKLPPIDHY